MFEVPLHVGIEHPSVLWFLVVSLLSFVTGLGIGIRSGHLQEWLRSGATERPANGP